MDCMHSHLSGGASESWSLLVNERGTKKEEEELNDNLGRGVGLQLSSVLLLGSINPKIFNW